MLLHFIKNVCTFAWERTVHHLFACSECKENWQAALLQVYTFINKALELAILMFIAFFLGNPAAPDSHEPSTGAVGHKTIPPPAGHDIPPNLGLNAYSCLQTEPKYNTDLPSCVWQELVFKGILLLTVVVEHMEPEDQAKSECSQIQWNTRNPASLLLLRVPANTKSLIIFLCKGCPVADLGEPISQEPDNIPLT